MRTGSSDQEGFTYLAVIFMVAIVGILLAANGILWSSVKASDDLEQLTFVGNQIRAAIGSYYEQSPGGVKRYPKHLDDLLKDERFAIPKRHLRQLFRDPFTDKTDWKLILADDGGVMGVRSSSNSTLDLARREFVYQPLTIAGGKMVN